MTLSEFKAWFEGFTESMDGPPNAKAWKRIQARVKEISGTAVTERVYIDRYVEPYRRYWYSTCSSSSSPDNISYTATGSSAAVQNFAGGSVATFDSHAAMTALGRAEAQTLAA